MHPELSQTAATAAGAKPLDGHEVRLGGYYATFTALLCLTFVTVFISTLHLRRPIAIAIGLAVAAVKAGLVASVFMHLASEKKIIYAVLAFTGLFFLLLLLLPLFTSPGGLRSIG